MFLERIADVLIYIGKNLSFYGASATEIEYYISKISKAYDIDVNIAAIGTVITLTVVDDHGKSITRIERVSYSEINFEKLSLWENMIKRVTEEKPTIFTLKQWIKDIEKKENLLGISFWKNIIAVFIASFGFCFVFRGNYTDAVASGISALLVYMATYKITSKIFRDFLAGLLVYSVIKLISRVVSISIFPSLAGGIMVFVPGLLLTNAIMEIGDRNLVSGSSKLMEAIFMLGSLVLGAAMASALWG